MAEKKPHVWEVDQDNFVHTRWCQGAGTEAKKVFEPYYTGPKTALDLLAQIALGDSQSQFGSENRGPGILKPCDACIQVLAEQEREDLP